MHGTVACQKMDETWFFKLGNISLYYFSHALELVDSGAMSGWSVKQVECIVACYWKVQEFSLRSLCLP